MINTLDSRALNCTNCYGQRFMKAGNYTYNIVPAHGAIISTDRPFAVTVKEIDPKAEMKTYPVRVTSGAGKFQVDDQQVIAMLVTCDGTGRQRAHLRGSRRS